MSPIREKFVKVIDLLPYNIDEEILKRSTKEILQDVTQKYVDTYGASDLSENDKMCIESLIGLKIWFRKDVILWMKIKKTLKLKN